MPGLLYPAYQKFYSAISCLERFRKEQDFFENISCLDTFFSEYRSITLVMQKSLTIMFITQLEMSLNVAEDLQVCSVEAWYLLALR